MSTSGIGGNLFGDFDLSNSIAGNEDGLSTPEEEEAFGSADKSFWGSSFFDTTDAGSNPHSGDDVSTDIAQLSWPKLPDFGNLFGNSLPEGEFTQQDLDGLTPAQERRISTITQETPTFLYHGFTDNIEAGDERRAYIDPSDDVPRVDRAGFDVDITDFENNLRHILDNGGNLVTTRDIVRSVIDENYTLPPNPHVIRIDDGDQTTALAVDVARKLSAEYPDREVKLELGINAGSVGSPGTDERYDDPSYSLSEEELAEDYSDATTPLTINDRKVTWAELGAWVEEDLVELSNHGDTHLFHASRESIDEKNITLGGRKVSELSATQVDAEILDGESRLEEKISGEIGEDYQVSTFIWPGGHFDNPASVGTFGRSGHVLGLGTEKQSNSSIPGQTVSPDPENPAGTFPGLYESTLDNIDPADPDLPIYDMPTITVGTSSDGRDGD